MSPVIFIALTGGPGGGKDALIEEILRDPAWSGHVSALPEAIALSRKLALLSDSKQFQHALVRLQMGMEDALAGLFAGGEQHLVLCNRSSLDPLAYWLSRGWDEGEFYTATRTTQEAHFQRYRAVLHLVTSADGAEQVYHSQPAARRAESPAEAIRLDKLLEHAWHGHPRYHRIENGTGGWEEKTRQSRRVLDDILHR